MLTFAGLGKESGQIHLPIAVRVLFKAYGLDQHLVLHRALVKRQMYVTKVNKIKSLSFEKIR